MIATQEPTISPALLDLCNVTIVHRFTSPAWYISIEQHIAGAATARANKEGETSLDLFGKIVRLGTGEALVFCPTAMLDVTSGLDHIEESSESNRGSSDASTEHQTVTKLGSEHIRLRVRKRITADGGRSQLAE